MLDECFPFDNGSMNTEVTMLYAWSKVVGTGSGRVAGEVFVGGGNVGSMNS